MGMNTPLSGQYFWTHPDASRRRAPRSRFFGARDTVHEESGSLKIMVLLGNLLCVNPLASILHERPLGEGSLA